MRWIPKSRFIPLLFPISKARPSSFLVSPTGGRNSLVDSEHRSADRIQVRVRAGERLFRAQEGSIRSRSSRSTPKAMISPSSKGSSEMLSDHRIRLIQFEYNFRWLAVRRSMRDVFKLAEVHGYRVGKADGGSIVVYGEWNAELDRYFEWNYLLITPELVKPLGAMETRWSESNTLVDSPRP